MKNVSIDDFWTNTWSPEVFKLFKGIDRNEFLSVVTRNDTYHTDEMTRANWKYGTSNGVYGTPAAFVNGVMLDEFPADAEAWKKLFQDMFAPND